MSSSKIDVDVLIEIKSRMIHYKDRNPTLKKALEFGDDYDSFYKWMINDWIVNQTDSPDLMNAFISLGFNMPMFVAFVCAKDWDDFCDEVVKYHERRKIH